MKHRISRSFRWQLSALAWLVFVLSECNTSPGPLRITDTAVSPESLIGQTATLHVEITSRRGEPDTTILIDLPPGVKLMEGDLTWEGSLIANQPQSHEIEICVLYEGDWRVWMSATSSAIEGERPGNLDTETLHIITTANTVQVVRGKDYRIAIPTEGM